MLDLVETALRHHHEASVRDAVNKAVAAAKARVRVEEEKQEEEGDSNKKREDGTMTEDEDEGVERALTAPSSSSSSSSVIAAIAKRAERAAVEKWKSLYTHCRLVRREHLMPERRRMIACVSYIFPFLHRFLSIHQLFCHHHSRFLLFASVLSHSPLVCLYPSPFSIFFLLGRENDPER